MLRSRVSYPPAPPKAPPRGCSRAVSCVGRPTHQDEPQAPWRACSGRYAAVGVWVARPTMGLVAHRLWVRNRTVNSAGNLPAAVQLRWLAVVQLYRDFLLPRRPQQARAGWPWERLRGHRKGHLAVMFAFRRGICVRFLTRVNVQGKGENTCSQICQGALMQKQKHSSWGSLNSCGSICFSTPEAKRRRVKSSCFDFPYWAAYTLMSEYFLLRLSNRQRLSPS